MKVFCQISYLMDHIRLTDRKKKHYSCSSPSGEGEFLLSRWGSKGKAQWIHNQGELFVDVVLRSVFPEREAYANEPGSPFSS
jgi:hypothetical protein